MTQRPPYYKSRSDYWGDGHWIITADGRDMGRASMQDNGKWSAYVEILPPITKTKMVPIKEDCTRLDDVFRALHHWWWERDARRAGQEHGWDHANYVDVYGPGPKLKPGEPGAMAKRIPLCFSRERYSNGVQVLPGGTPATYAAYKAGWAQGVRWFKAGKNYDGTKKEG